MARYMKHKKTILSIAICAVLVVACIRPSSTRKRIDPNTPTLGNLNGVQMAIPLKYQFFPVEYEGDDIWNAEWQRKNLGRVPTPDMKIRFFSMLLHLPDFMPLSKANRLSWIKPNNKYGTNRDWINVGVRWNGGDQRINQKGWLESYIGKAKYGNSTRVSSDWRYQTVDEDFYGLRHETLVGSTTPANYYERNLHRELYYDATAWSTKIECDRMLVEPFSESTCTQVYGVPELNSIVEVTYHPDNIKNWREIQRETHLIIESFEPKIALPISHW
jgi:hypothetical protein